MSPVLVRLSARLMVALTTSLLLQLAAVAAVAACSNGNGFPY